MSDTVNSSISALVQMLLTDIPLDVVENCTEAITGSCYPKQNVIRFNRHGHHLIEFVYVH
jgi:hypothetical protein